MTNKINNLTPDEWYEKFMQTLEKSSAEFNQRLEKSSAEFEKWRQESEADLKQWRKETQRQIGGITKSTGAITEALIFNTLEKNMKFGGIEFDDIRPNMGYHSKKLDNLIWY